MLLFYDSRIRRAYFAAALGWQALHVYPPIADFPDTPLVFRRAKLWAHLFDRSKTRLVATARRLGVRSIVVHKEGTPYQHIDLCGKPLDKAVAEAVTRRIRKVG